MKSKGKTENLIPVRSKDEAREIGRKGGIKSGEVRKEKKLISMIYADFLAKKFDVEGEQIHGDMIVENVIREVLSRGDSASVSMLKEIREATEGSKQEITGKDGAPLVESKVDVSKLTKEEKAQFAAIAIKTMSNDS